MATLKAMFKLFDGYSTTVDKINRKTDDATNKISKASGATDKFNDKLEATGASASTASGGLGKFLSVTAAIATAIKGMDITDEYTNTSARLGLITDNLKEQEELQNKIFAAADRSKGSYTAMAAAVAKMGITASEAFGGNNDQLVAFTELIQKGFKVGGASATEQSSAMLQLTQAMGAGKLQGDEFRSIMENAPMIADAIAKYTGKSKGELKQMSADGVITSDIIKNAMFMASDDINAKFATMPYTFADIWNRIKNAGTEAFSGLMGNISTLLNTDGFTDFINGIIGGIYMLANIINYVINFVSANWPVIQAILIGIGVFLLINVIGYLSAAIPVLATFIAMWYSANLPLLAIAATVVVVILMFQALGITVESVFGFIGGIIGSTVAFIMNLVIMLWNGFVDFINFLYNAFNNPLLSIQIMFSSWSSNILGFILGIAQGLEDLINKIPGVTVDMTSGIAGIKDKLDADISNLKTEADWTEYVKKADYVDYTIAATKGSNIGKDLYGDIGDAINGLIDPLTQNGKNNTGLGDSSLGIKPITVKGTGKNDAVKVDMSDEDLQYLRDIAEREYINKFSAATVAPNIQVSFGNVYEEADVDKIHGKIRKILQEEIAMAAEGAY